MSKRKARPYHKRWHGDALQGYRRLSLELRGAYTTLLDVMYDHGGPVEERFACVWLDCDPRVWKRIRHDLVETHGKVLAFVDADGVSWLVNERVQKELGLPTYAELTAKIGDKFGIAKPQLTESSEQNANENNERETGENQKSGSLLPLPLPDNSVPSERAPGKPDAEPDRGKQAWALARRLLKERAGMSDAASGKFFGGLLSKAGLTASAMLPSLLNCEDSGSPEVKAYLTKAAERVAERRGESRTADPEPIPVGQWPEARWRAALEIHKETGQWGETMGAKPGSPGCRAPPDLLKEFGFKTERAA